MANLITEKQKKIIKNEYLIRFISTSLLLASLLAAFLAAYVIPYYISVSKKALIADAQLQNSIETENKENVGKSASRIVNRTLDELKIAELYAKNSSISSENFTKIIKSKNSSIQITKLSFSVLKKGQGQFLVSGISKDRTSLVAFIDNLKFIGDFTSVESPVSDFVRDVNIPFTINIRANI